MEIFPGEHPRPTELLLLDKLHYLPYRIKGNKCSKFGERGNSEVFFPMHSIGTAQCQPDRAQPELSPAGMRKNV